VGQPLPGIAASSPAQPPQPAEPDPSFEVGSGEEKRTPQKKGVSFNTPDNKGTSIVIA
jgi:hypothetical protein